MDNFLKSACADIYSKYKNIFDRTTIVFPNKRAGLFFTKYLSEINTETIWSPEIITLSDFIERLSGKHKADTITLIFKLYNIYRKHVKTSESFDDFYFWGEMLLNDFDDIDKYLVNAEDLFQNIYSLKEIDAKFSYLTEEQLEAIKMFWTSFNPEKYSKGQEDFLVIWENLDKIYKEFRTELEASNICYEGIAYRNIVEKIKKGSLDINSQKVVFIGFNALNKCEDILFQHLRDNGIAEFYWDYDSYYMNNPHHEAGFYMRKNLKNFPNALGEKNYNVLAHNGKKINFISVPSDIGQTKILSEPLKKIDKKDYEKTAIVLADENLLLPVLHSIPEEIDKINVTMGYPAQNSPVAGFIKHIIELQATCKSSDKDTMFYHKPLMALLNHQYIFNEETKAKIDEIIKYNNIYISAKRLNLSGLPEKIFIYPTDTSEAGKYLSDILLNVFKKIDGIEEQTDIHKIEKEYIYNLFLNIKRLNSILEENDIEILTSTYYRIIEKLIKNLSIPFTGEPLEGLQVMGLMETRILDFENLYILSVNEGKLPKTGSSSSYIPYNLRKGFGLPTLEHQDSMFSYYFYRLIQRAKNVNLLYSTKSDGMNKGEMSRFLYQLKYESKLDINESVVVNQITTGIKKDITISKSDEIIEKLTSLSTNKQKPLSPSAINTYLGCQLRFYFKYIADIKEPEEITEEIDPPTFGNIFHESMEKLYAQAGKKVITENVIDDILASKNAIDDALYSSFGDCYYKSKQFEINGKNSIIYDIIKRYIRRVLELDKQYCPFTILSVEDRFSMPVEVSTNGKYLEVYLGGIIDRIDKTNEGIRVLDYKTGKAETKFKTIENLFDKDTKKQNKAVLQTLIYCMFYDYKYAPSEPIIPGIYILKDVFSKNYNYKLTENYDYGKNRDINDYSVFKDELKKGLNNMVMEMFDRNTDFVQTDDDKSCSSCPYKELCHR